MEASSTRWRTVATLCGYAALALALSVSAYFPKRLAVRPSYPDAAFYVHQLDRAGGVNGQWWRITEAADVGHPYPQATAEHPAFFEGVECLLLAPLTARLVDPWTQVAVHFLIILTFNGVVAGGLAWRYACSAWAGALAVVLITLNYSTLVRIPIHLHLINLGWPLLLIDAFSRYLDAPTARRGLWVGLFTALTAQSVLYFGILVPFGLALWGVGMLVLGRLTRAHVVPTLVAVAVAVVGAAVFLFPVVGMRSTSMLAEGYVTRDMKHIWRFSAELWQYFVPPLTYPAEVRLDAAGLDRNYVWGNWHYPGVFGLLTLAAYLLARARGNKVGDWPGDRLVGLIGLFVLISLSGGPSALLLNSLPGIRCFGRSGVIALALLCVAAPVILACALRALARRWAHCALLAAALLVVAGDLTLFARTVRRFRHHADLEPYPAWVKWLEEQPADTALVALSGAEMEAGYFTDCWHWNSADRFLRHGRRTLNGARLEYLVADLRLLGTRVDKLSPQGMRFLASLGYPVVACDKEFVRRCPWIATADWLEPVAVRGDWAMFRVRPQALLPVVDHKELLREGLSSATPRPVPAGTWLTESLDLSRVVVTQAKGGVTMRWHDDAGRPAGEPMSALHQHCYGPNLPAYVVESPRTPGRYTLRFSVEGVGEVSRAYDVRASEVVGEEEALARNQLELSTEEWRGGVRVVVHNRTGRYLPANGPRAAKGGQGRFHPNLQFARSGAVFLALRQADPKSSVWHFLTDLPAGARREWFIPAGELTHFDPEAKVEAFLDRLGTPLTPRDGEADLSLGRAAK